jgi:hypothetical protein
MDEQPAQGSITDAMFELFRVFFTLLVDSNGHADGRR